MLDRPRTLDGTQTPRFEPDQARADFPILSRQVHGKPLTYLDNAASAQKPQVVLDAIAAAYGETYANVHRGIHFLSTASTTAFEQARETAARFINAATPDEIVFTKGGTEAINLVANCLAAEIREGDEIILSDMEHHANIVPWHFLRERHGAVLRWAPITDEGELDLDAFAKLLTPRTKLVAITQMSNVLGTITPLREIIRLAHAAGARVLVDGCQGAVHETVDVQALGSDFYVTTGHKLYGPTGIGFLHARFEHLQAMRPYQGGGEMIGTVARDGITYAEPPHRFEAGTPPFVQAIGLAAALDYLDGFDRTAVTEHEARLLAHVTEELDKVGHVRILGRAAHKGALVSLDIRGVHPHDASMLLDRAGIAVRAGNHCAQPLMDHLGVPGSLRASFALYNTHADVEIFVAGIRKVREFFL